MPAVLATPAHLVISLCRNWAKASGVPPTTVMIGHGDTIRLNPQFRKTDYEGELAVVIGRALACRRSELASTACVG